MANIVILVGIPCSGKSTWARNFKYVVSRDTIREYLFGKNYKQNFDSEKLVTSNFNEMLDSYIEYIKEPIILDNTHCKKAYIDEILKRYSKQNIKIKFFDVSLPKAYYRNIKRWIFTGKWIPFKVIDQMYKNYKKINKKDYEQYLFL